MNKWSSLIRMNIAELNFEMQKKIYTSFYHFVYKDIFFIIRKHADIEDIIQEAFLKVINQGPKITHATNLSAWVRKITRNTTIDWLRKNKQKHLAVNWDNTIIDEQEIFISKEDTYISVEKKIRDEMLYLAIEELKPEHRILIIMFYLEGKSYKKICKELSLTEQIMTQRLARARKKLRKYFSQNDMIIYQKIDG